MYIYIYIHIAVEYPPGLASLDLYPSALPAKQKNIYIYIFLKTQHKKTKCTVAK